MTRSSQPLHQSTGIAVFKSRETSLGNIGLPFLISIISEECRLSWLPLLLTLRNGFLLNISPFNLTGFT